ncbi:MAG: hypothetical protein EOP06_17995 [Proteobacteria bacterium]|nr:MAG: hypothetical protein EOP06_17995 [Pseudomonadota bacterium]
MIIAFQNSELQKLCKEPEVADEKLGAAVAAKLREVLADMNAVNKLDGIFTAQVSHHISDNLVFTIDLIDGFKLYLKVNHAQASKFPNSKIRPESVRRVLIISIGREDA